MPITNGYCTQAELASKMGLSTTKTTTHAALLDSSIENASRWIDVQTNTIFFTQVITDEVVDVLGPSDNGFVISPNCSAIIAPAPIISISSLTERGEALTEQIVFGGTGDYTLKKGLGTIVNSGGWSTAALAIVLSGSIGLAEVPKDVREICLTVASVYTRLDDRVVTSADGDMEAILASKIPGWVKTTLRRLRRPIV